MSSDSPAQVEVISPPPFERAQRAAAGQRVLVAFGSKRGSTAQIATAIAETLRAQGLTVDRVRAAQVRDVASYDAVVIGGALYAARWIREARRFVVRNAPARHRRGLDYVSCSPLRIPVARLAAAHATLAHGRRTAHRPAGHPRRKLHS